MEDFPAVSARAKQILGVNDERNRSSTSVRRRLGIFCCHRGCVLDYGGIAARGDEIDDLIALHKRVQALYEAGKCAQAEPLARELLQRGERVFKDQPANLASLIENASMLYTAEGKYSLAEPLYQRALKIRQASFGADHSSVAQSLYSLAKLYRLQGKYAAAEPHFQRAIRIQEKTLGPDNPALAWTLNDLGLLCARKGSMLPPNRCTSEL